MWPRVGVQLAGLQSVCTESAWGPKIRGACLPDSGLHGLKVFAQMVAGALQHARGDVAAWLRATWVPYALDVIKLKYDRRTRVRLHGPQGTDLTIGPTPHPGSPNITLGSWRKVLLISIRVLSRVRHGRIKDPCRNRGAR